MTKDAPNGGHGRIVAPDAVCFERLFPGPIERVWAYLVDSDKRGRWLASGRMPAEPGAPFEMRFDHDSLSSDKAVAPEPYRQYAGGVISRHRMIRMEPPRLLVISWGGGSEPESEVKFELSEEPGGVRLVLTHYRLPDLDEMVNVSGGWHTHLAVLAERLAGREPLAFWTLFEGVEDDYARRFGA